MPQITSISSFKPPHTLKQDVTTEFARELFSENFQDIERLLKAFSNGQIEERQFAMPLEWFRVDHSLEEKNDLYIELATKYGVEAINLCLANALFLKQEIDVANIDAIIFVSSSGMATPSIEARIMNVLPFSPHTKRIPIWGLGCAGGASGIARGFEYCKAYPTANALVVCVELCSLTFQRNDLTKSNLIGTSLFADGVACALITGDESSIRDLTAQPLQPAFVQSRSTLMPNSEDVMGWEMKDSGLHVVFSRDIPNIIKKWLRRNVEEFLETMNLKINDLTEFIAHPGGKKVIDAYLEVLEIDQKMTRESQRILQKHGNMSSPTVLYVLEEIMKKQHNEGDYGLMAALGPGFSSELVLLQWKGVH
ncbi:type III polyketide synthase [Anaerobacillus arseniciselenatis]|uniref:Type III polyketide synthase n=1 Tax=Anaerobacillus arseniciselenatis TaxID=85682 RepID=A0A1S2LGF0_9BACI|nr:3-oxoacyl-[acyl-carrier-protein] synthase III C-terminal domain-containing protein [Anaerobacillus arseniciselenatis]OIJ11578.1 type III polyketide synthase [Anaerobacillus arseniciselenatis]